MVLVICAAAGLGNGSVFKIIPLVLSKEAGAAIGIVSCVGALGASFRHSCWDGRWVPLAAPPGLTPAWLFSPAVPGRERVFLSSPQFTHPLLRSKAGEKSCS